MPIFCIWSGGDGTQTDTTQTASTLDWSKADTTIASLVGTYATALTTSGNIIYIAHDHTDQETHAATRTFTGPTSGAPAMFISADRGQSTPTYLASSTNQIDTAKDGAFQIVFDGSFALYGLCIASGATSGIVLPQNDNNEFGHVEGCTLKLAANADMTIGGTNCRVVFKNNVIDLTQDGTTNRTAVVLRSSTGWYDVSGLSFVNPGYRTTAVFGPGVGHVMQVSGCDFSGFPEATELATGAGSIEFINCKMRSNQVLGSTFATATSGYLSAVNCGPSAAPESLRVFCMASTLESDATVTRDGGASVDSVDCSWKFTASTSGANIAETAPFYTPWIYSKVASTGSKTFTIYIANNTADLYDDEVWLEVEYMGTSGNPTSTMVSDKRATVTTTRAVQTDDTTSTWTGATLTYKQSLTVTATVGQAGLCRARVAVGKVSLSGLYIDPKVTVT